MVTIFAIIEKLHRNELHWVCWPMVATFIKIGKLYLSNISFGIIWGLHV